MDASQTLTSGRHPNSRSMSCRGVLRHRPPPNRLINVVWRYQSIKQSAALAPPGCSPQHLHTDRTDQQKQASNTDTASQKNSPIHNSICMQGHWQRLSPIGPCKEHEEPRQPCICTHSPTPNLPIYKHYQPGGAALTACMPYSRWS